MIDKAPIDAITSGDHVYFTAHTGKQLEVESETVRARWNDFGMWQRFRLERQGGGAIFSGDAVFITAHTGKVIDVEDDVVLAKWNDRGSWRRLIIEKNGGG